MSDQMLSLPPDQPLSAAHKADLRRRLQDEFRRSRPSTSRHRRFASLLVAGTAVVAAAGVVTVGALVHNGTHQTEPAAIKKNPTMHRCWSAVSTAGKIDRYPDASTWRVVLQSDRDMGFGMHMVGVQADKTVFFCATTPTTVQVSAPVGNPSKQVRPLLAIPNGPVGGLSDGRKSLKLIVASKAGAQWGDTGAVLDRSKRLFIGGTVSDNSFLAVGDALNWQYSRKKALPDPPPPAVQTVDRPQKSGGGDAQRRKVLQTCVHKSDMPPMVSVDTLTPGAQFVDGKHKAIVATGPHGYFMLCAHEVSEPIAPTRSFKFPEPTPQNPVVMHAKWSGTWTQTELHGGTATGDIAMGGYVHPDVAKLTFSNDGKTYTAAVEKGTFAVAMRAKVPEKEAEDEWRAFAIPATAYDKTGKVIFHGVIQPQ